MPRASSSRSRGGKKRCPICEGSFSPQTFAAHSRKCVREKKAEEESMKSAKELRRRPVAQVAYTRASAPSRSATSTTRDGFGASHLQHLHLPAEMEIKASHPDASPSTSTAADDDTTANSTRVRHRSTGKSRKSVKKIRHLEASDEHARNSSQRSRTSKLQRSRGKASASVIEPWSPFFDTHEDYCLAEIIQDWELSEEQGDRLIDLAHDCSSGHGSITFMNISQVDAAWERYHMCRDDSDYYNGENY